MSNKIDASTGDTARSRHPAKHKNLAHYIGYLRVSKDTDATGSFTFETQKSRIIEYLDRMHGARRYQLTFLQDDGLSGGYGLTPTGVQPKVRPSLQQIADMIRTGQYEGVIVYGQNRFFRNTRALMEMVQDVLLPAGKNLLSATEELDINTADGRMMLYMKALFDEKQREDIIKRNRDAAATRAEHGYAIGQVGYGWGWDTHRNPDEHKRRGIVPQTEEKIWVVHIKERYLSGWNASRIAAELNDLHVSSPLCRGLWSEKAQKQRLRDGREPRWTNGTVWNVLKNPLHAGLVQLRDQRRIHGQHWPHRYWEPEVLDQIEELHRQRISRFKTCTGQQKAPHLLNGLIHCARCGRRLYMSSTSESTKNHRAYKCRTGADEGRFTCPEVTVRAAWVEEAVIDIISHVAQQPEMRRLLDAEVESAVGREDEELQREKVLLKRNLATIEEKFERWADGFSSGVMTAEQFSQYSSKLSQEAEVVKGRLAEVTQRLEGKAGRELWLQQVKQQFESFPLVWDELDSDEKRQVLATLIEPAGIKADREGRDVKLTIKPELLPVQERTILYRSFRGLHRTRATGLQRLTLRQMVLLHYAGEGKSRRECAELMGCKVPSIYTLEKTIRKNLGHVTWQEAVEMARVRVQENLKQLPLGRSDRVSVAEERTGRHSGFLSPILMETFELYAQGATIGEVAQRLNLSTTTVQGRRARILKHFVTNSMLEAVEKARAQGIVLVKDRESH